MLVDLFFLVAREAFAVSRPLLVDLSSHEVGSHESAASAQVASAQLAPEAKEIAHWLDRVAFSFY